MKAAKEDNWPRVVFWAKRWLKLQKTKYPFAPVGVVGTRKDGPPVDSGALSSEKSGM